MVGVNNVGPNSFLDSAPVSHPGIDKLIKEGILPIPALRVKHKDFGYGPATHPPLLRSANSRFAAISMKKMLTSYSKRNITEFEKAKTQMENFFYKLEPFLPLLVESDLADLSATCHMGSRPRAHAQSDEGRPVGNNKAPIVWNDRVWDSVRADWKPIVDDMRSKGGFKDLKVVLPAGTSLGWPFLFSDDKEGSRSLVLAAIALAMDVEKQKGNTLADVHAYLSTVYSPRFIAPGWRYQHSPKAMPVLTASSQFWTQNVEFRVRLIGMVDKVSVVWNRIMSKRAVAVALKMDAHNQDRSYIQKTLSQWQNEPGRKVVAVDVSGFDGGLGGPNLVKILSIIDELFTFPGEKSHLNDLVAEVTAPMLVPVGRSMWETDTKITPQLPSGASFTTVVGLIASDYIRHLLAHHCGIKMGTGTRDMKSLSWGDDMVISVPSDVDLVTGFKKTSEDMRLEFDFEPTIKYLGFNYGSGKLKTRVGYSRGRLIQKSVFPESMSFYPFSLIGYIARLQFLFDDAETFHRLFTETFWDRSRYGDPFPFSERQARLAKALEDSLTVDRGHQDSLNFLLHGLDPIEGETLLNSIDFDFTKWIGRSFIDVTDPIANPQALNLSGDVARVSLPLLRRVKADGVAGLTYMVSQLSPIKGWRHEGIVL